MPTKAEIEEYLEKHKIQAEIEKAIKEIVKDGMPPDPLKILAEKLMKADKAAAAAGPFSFASGLPDCCAASPDLYKTIAEIPGVARLVEMVFPPGAKDAPHEHPVHSMYFVTDVKLKIAGGPTPTKLGEEGAVIEAPAGATPIFPAMAHQVENVGDKEGKAVFVEAYPNCKPCGDVEGYISPFAVSPECYKILAEDDDWYTGMLTMEVGAKDAYQYAAAHPDALAPAIADCALWPAAVTTRTI